MNYHILQYSFIDGSCMAFLTGRSGVGMRAGNRFMIREGSSFYDREQNRGRGFEYSDEDCRKKRAGAEPRLQTAHSVVPGTGSWEKS